MKTNQKQENKSLEKFSITKQEALSLEGGPVTDRGTVTTPAETEPPT
ncbi:hypothetical protein KUL156_56110 [Alteromonas sp. KUL156]|nr:hypothetical protein KUL154_59790 [Alteromonas sp. KUL154]GFE03019.1 hypothetical protein KUL156_56110 [Alteromonas sp. KUL156]